jgi:hypothetical protein
MCDAAQAQQEPHPALLALARLLARIAVRKLQTQRREMRWPA